jgi:RNA polymerase sigma-B factor
MATHEYDDEAELFRAYFESRTTEARNLIVERYAGLAAALARRFEQRGEPLQDLVQVANMALIGAVERFEPAQGNAFSSFATPTILGELKRHFRDKTWSIRVPRGLKELHLRITPAVSELHAELGRGPTIPELAAHLCVGEDELLEAMEAGAAYRPASLTQPSNAESAHEDRALTETESGYDNIEARLTVQALLEKLPERQRAIVSLRYFEDLTQSEIAARLGVSQVHVSRLLRDAMDRLAAVSLERVPA